MKKIIKIILLIIVLISLYLIVISFLTNKNKNYLDSITKDIKANYDLDEKITYSNLYGNYYILTTKKEVIVLNKEYEEILVKDIDILASNPNNYELIYKSNKLMYEETILDDTKLTYNYYDATTGKLLKETDMKEEVRWMKL